MSGPDRDHDSGADELARTATPLDRDLAALVPAAPSGGLRGAGGDLPSELMARLQEAVEQAKVVQIYPTQWRSLAHQCRCGWHGLTLDSAR